MNNDNNMAVFVTGIIFFLFIFSMLFMDTKGVTDGLKSVEPVNKEQTEK